MAGGTAVAAALTVLTALTSFDIRRARTQNPLIRSVPGLQLAVLMQWLYICDCLCIASFNVHYIPSSFHEPPSPPGHPPGCLDHAPQIASSASNRYIQSSIKHVILHNITHISQFTNIALYSFSQLRIWLCTPVRAGPTRPGCWSMGRYMPVDVYALCRGRAIACMYHTFACKAASSTTAKHDALVLTRAPGSAGGWRVVGPNAQYGPAALYFYVCMRASMYLCIQNCICIRIWSPNIRLTGYR